MLKRFLLIAALTMGMFSFSFAQENNTKLFTGVWKGALDIQGQSFTVIFTFAEKDGKLSGTAESPEQGGGTISLDNIAVTGNKIQFDIAPIRGGFEGVYKEEKKVLDGSIVMGEQGYPITLEKDTKAAADEAKKFTSIWEGAIDFQGKSIRLVLKIYSNEDGTLGAMVDSPDQGVSNIPADGVKLTDENLSFNMPSASAVYSGKIDKATMTAKGTFTQRGSEFALELKKSDKPIQK